MPLAAAAAQAVAGASPPAQALAAVASVGLVLVVFVGAIVIAARTVDKSFPREPVVIKKQCSLQGVEIRRLPSADMPASPPPSPPPEPVMIGRLPSEFTLTPEEIEMCSRMLIEGGGAEENVLGEGAGELSKQGALPPAEAPPVKSRATVSLSGAGASKDYLLTGIPPFCEGASAQEDQGSPAGLKVSDDIPLFLSSGLADIAAFAAPAAGPERTCLAFPSSGNDLPFDFSAPSVEASDGPARKLARYDAPCADVDDHHLSMPPAIVAQSSDLLLSQAEALIRDVSVETEPAQPPAGESPLASPRHYVLNFGSQGALMHAPAAPPSSAAAEPPAPESSPSNANSWSNSGPHPPAYESPLLSSPASVAVHHLEALAAQQQASYKQAQQEVHHDADTQAVLAALGLVEGATTTSAHQPAAAHAGVKRSVDHVAETTTSSHSPQMTTPPTGAPLSASASPPAAIPAAANVSSLAVQLEIMRQLQTIASMGPPSAAQTQALMSAGIHPSLVQQLQQLAQLQAITSNLAAFPGNTPAAAAPHAPAAAARPGFFGPTFPRPQGAAGHLPVLAPAPEQSPAPDVASGPLPHGMGLDQLSSFGVLPNFGVMHAAQSAEVHGQQLMAQQQQLQIMQHPHLPRPQPREMQEMLQVWMARKEEVDACAEKRKGQGQFEQRSHRHYCQGCGRSKAGHRRSEVHSKCIDANCWCGVKRLLHPYTLPAGARCHGEWRDIVARHLDPNAPLLTEQEHETMRTCGACAPAPPAAPVA